MKVFIAFIAGLLIGYLGFSMTHKPKNETPQVASIEASESCAPTAPTTAEAPIPNGNQDVYSKLELKATTVEKAVLPEVT